MPGNIRSSTREKVPDPRIVGGNHQGCPVTLRGAVQQLQALARRIVVQAGGGLVGGNHPGLHQHCAGQCHPLRLPARQLRRQAVGKFRHTDRGQRGIDTAAVLRHAGRPKGQAQVLRHGQRCAHVQLLRQEPERAGAPGVGLHAAQRCQVLSRHFQHAGTRRYQRRYQGQPGRLAAARGAAQQERSALRDSHIREMQRRSVGIGELQGAGLDHGAALVTRQRAPATPPRQTRLRGAHPD